jgi:hypothetical protein
MAHQERALHSVTGMLAALALFSMAPASSGAVTLLSEDFNGLTLTDSVDEGVAGPVGDGGGTAAADVWTGTPPAGWTQDDTGVPGAANPPDNNGVAEWAGWNFADRDWWVLTAGDQGRGDFLNASGTVMVADPDEWDDAPHPGGPPSGPWYSAFIRTAAISLAAIAPDTVTLDFDSSWRREFDDNYHQTANITVSFDGGAAVEVLRWTSEPGDASFKSDATNEHVTLGINNPSGASQMVITFGLFDAGNDWWWALDNLDVSGTVPEPTTALLLACGLVGLRRRLH